MLYFFMIILLDVAPEWVSNRFPCVVSPLCEWLRSSAEKRECFGHHRFVPRLSSGAALGSKQKIFPELKHSLEEQIEMSCP